MNIAIILFAYPVLSETFVINELFQLQQRGVQGTIWREKQGNGAEHPKSQKLSFPIIDLPIHILGKNFTRLCRAHFQWLWRKPRIYLQTLWEVIRFFPDGESLKIFLKSAVVAQQVEASSAELIYVHESDRAYVFGLCVARLCELPLILIFHTYYLFVVPRYIVAKVRTADGLVFQSEYSRRYVEQLISDNQQVPKMYVVSSPGIDTALFKPAIKKRVSNEKTKKLSLISVGRLEEAKGFQFLIEAVALLKRKGWKVDCDIIGEGSLRQKLEQLIKKEQLTKEVKLHGALPHGRKLTALLQHAEYFVLPSVQDSEGVHDVHPNAVKEAMATELIVVTTNLDSIDEVITHGIDGFIIQQATAELITQQLIKVALLSERTKTKIKQQARRKVTNLFDEGKMTTALLEVFSHYVKKDV
ncbi:glycosyltransferase family 4 protein [Patescibacteria group bacterium]|nr:glycosyltransferase family 4 protein [Patescibacteria group bacterium]